MMLAAPAWMLMLALAGAPVPPTSANNASADEVAFGLGALRWGMSPPEARGRFPKLDGVAAEPGQPVSNLALHDYPVAGCRFTVMLSFESGKLATIDLDSEGPSQLKACGGRIKTMLTHQYGGEPGGFSTAPNPHGFSEYGSWGGPVTEVTYSALDNAFLQVHFARTPQWR